MTVQNAIRQKMDLHKYRHTLAPVNNKHVFQIQQTFQNDNADADESARHHHAAEEVDDRCDKLAVDRRRYCQLS